MASPQLYLNLKNGNDIGGGGPVLTGPSFVDKSNIDTDPPVREAEHPLTEPGRWPCLERRPPHH